jgi:hypothetical protein
MRLRALAAFPLIAALVSALVVGPAMAQSAGAADPVPAPAPTGWAGCEKSGGAVALCDIGGELPGDAGGARNPATGFTPPPLVCVAQSESSSRVIECEYEGGWWSNSRQCYVKYGALQGAPLISPDPAGAWYDCLTAGSQSGCWKEVRDAGLCEGLRLRERFFSLTSPPGITVMAPGQAAAIFAASFPLNAITIGLAPDPELANSRTYVGVPAWMWAKNPTPDTFGPYTESGTVGGLNITATATVTSLLWTMGDGSTVACATGGTPYDPGLGFIDSPNCGHRYSQTSVGQQGSRFPITATSQWDIVWAVGGVGGTINVTTVAESSVEVRELQSVNVGN